MTGRSVSIVGFVSGYLLGFGDLVWMVVLSGLLLSTYSMSLESLVLLVRMGRGASRYRNATFGGMVVQALSFSTALDSFLYPQLFSSYFYASLMVFFASVFLLYIVSFRIGRIVRIGEPISDSGSSAILLLQPEQDWLPLLKDRRFITQDSYPGSATDPMTMDRYVYARDDPERYVDPSGHMAMHSMWDFGGTTDPNYQITTSSNCLNGVCTVTTTATYGGYTSSISTTMGTTYTSPGATVTTMSTTTADTNPDGSTRIRYLLSVTTTPLTRYASATTEPTTDASPSDTGTKWSAAIWTGLLTTLSVVGLFDPEVQLSLWVAPAAAPFVDAGLAGGLVSVWNYDLSHRDNPNPDQVIQAYDEGFWSGFTLCIFGKCFG